MVRAAHRLGALNGEVTLYRRKRATSVLHLQCFVLQCIAARAIHSPGVELAVPLLALPRGLRGALPGPARARPSRSRPASHVRPHARHASESAMRRTRRADALVGSAHRRSGYSRQPPRGARGRGGGEGPGCRETRLWPEAGVGWSGAGVGKRPEGGKD